MTLVHALENQFITIVSLLLIESHEIHLEHRFLTYGKFLLRNWPNHQIYRLKFHLGIAFGKTGPTVVILPLSLDL